MPVVAKIKFNPFADYSIVLPVKYTTKLGRFIIEIKDISQKQAMLNSITAAMQSFDQAELEKAKCGLQAQTSQLISADENMLHRVMSVAESHFRKTKRSVDKIIVVGTKLESPMQFVGSELGKLISMSNFGSDRVVCWEVAVGVYERESFTTESDEPNYSYRFLRDHRIIVFGENVSDDIGDLKWEMKHNTSSIVVIPFTDKNAKIISEWIERKLTTLMDVCVQSIKVRNELLASVDLPAIKQKSEEPLRKSKKKSSNNPKGKRDE